MKRGKTDAADAEAICEAVTRPTMRFVAVKSVEQQAVLMLHKSRDLMVRQRTMLINALRGHLAEYGIVTGLGAAGVVASLKALHEEQDRFPAHARSALHGIAAQLRALASEIERLELEAEGARRAAEEAEARAREAASGAAASAAAEEDGDGDGRGASQEELKSALLAATEPLSAKIDEYRGRLDEAEREAERQRQENRQLAASLARAEVTASSNLAAEEAAVGYKNDAEQTRQRELDLREELDAVIRDRDSLRRRNEELVAGDAAAGDQEVKLMREQLEEAQALRMREEDATRKCKQLQRENKDLRWQIAMTSSDDSIKIDVPKHLDPKRNLPQPKGPFAVLVKHRKHVAVCYLLFLHFLVYFALTHHSERSHHHQQGQLQHQ